MTKIRPCRNQRKKLSAKNNNNEKQISVYEENGFRFKS